MRKQLSLLLALLLIGCMAQESARRNIAPANLVAQQAQTCATAAPAVLCVAITVTPGSGLATVTPNVTPLATVIATQGQPTPTQIAPQTTAVVPTIVAVTVQPNGPNLLTNPSFEFGYYDVQYGAYKYAMAANWWPYFCASAYMSYRDSDCPALRRDTRSPARSGFNDPSLLMGRPEYGSSACCYGRWRSGMNAQKMFSFRRVHQGGVCQSAHTEAGAIYEAGAYVQTWSAKGEVGTDGIKWHSDTATQDDRDNSTWYVRVIPGGFTDNKTQIDVFAKTAIVSRSFTYADGHYDKFAPIRLVFEATSSVTTICFENIRLWPNVHNDGHIDDAWLKRAN